MVTTSARTVMGLLSAAMMVVPVVACSGDSEVGGAPASTAVSQPTSRTAISQPPVSKPPVSQPAVAPSTLSPSTVSQPPATASVGSSAPFSGYVQQIYSTGDFVLVSGPVTYTVVMLPTTTVVNLRGQRVPQQYIAVSGMVEVTGVLESGRITAQNVLVPTVKDDV